MMDFKNKKVAMIATTVSMISNFMVPHIQWLVQQGAVVDCYSNTDNFDCSNLDMENVNVYHIPFTRSPFTMSNLKGYKQLKKYFKENKYDLVSCMQPVGGVMGRMIAKKFKVPCLYTAHGFHFFKGCPLKNKLIYKTIEKHFAKYTDVLVTINEEDYQSALKFKAKKVYKINGIGVDLSTYKINKDLDKVKFKKSLGLEKDDFIITSIGELNENKNTYRLLECIKNIDNPKVKYLICGRGPLQEKYEKYIKENNLQDRVKVLGYRKDIPDILTIADVYIMPSYREGLSKSMMEAMCCGAPIVCSKIRGNIDLVGGDGIGGYMCNPSSTEEFTEAILKVLNNTEEVKDFTKRNKEFIKNFDIKVVLKQMEEIYKEM